MALCAGDVIVRHPDHPDRAGEWTVTGRGYYPPHLVDIDYTTPDGGKGVFAVDPTTPVMVLPREVVARDRYVAGLLILADLLDANPDIPLPDQGNPARTVQEPLHGYTGRAGAAAMVAAWGRPTRVEPGTAYVSMCWELEGLRFELSVAAKQIGEQHVTREERLAGRTVEVIEWVIEDEFLPEPAASEPVSEVRA